MENQEKQPYSKPPPPSVRMTVVVCDPPCKFDPRGWDDYLIVPLDKYTKVLLVAWQGQDIHFDTGQSSVDQLDVGGDSSKQSPRPSD